MKFNKSLMTATILTAASLTVANAAGTATGSFDVKLNITSVCTVNAAKTAQDINFGDVPAGTAISAALISNRTSATALSVQCSKGAPYVINLSPTNVSSTTGAGSMSGPAADKITYQLHSDSAGKKAWGNTSALGTAGNGVGGTGTGLSTAINHPVYSTVTSTTDVTVGAYTDTVNVSVIY